MIFSFYSRLVFVIININGGQFAGAITLWINLNASVEF